MKGGHYVSDYQADAVNRFEPHYQWCLCQLFVKDSRHIGKLPAKMVKRLYLSTQSRQPFVGLLYYHRLIGLYAKPFESFRTAFFVTDVNFPSEFSHFERMFSGNDQHAITISNY